MQGHTDRGFLFVRFELLHAVSKSTLLACQVQCHCKLCSSNQLKTLLLAPAGTYEFTEGSADETAQPSKRQMKKKASRAKKASKVHVDTTHAAAQGTDAKHHVCGFTTSILHQ